MDETTHVTDIQVQDKKKRFFYSTFSGGHICRPAWLRTNKFLIVETERGILCCSHSEGLEGPPGELFNSNDYYKQIPIFLYGESNLSTGRKEKSAEVEEQAVFEQKSK